MREDLSPAASHFAERAGISAETLRRAERGRGPVSLHTSRKIASALGLETADIAESVWLRERKATS